MCVPVPVRKRLNAVRGQLENTYAECYFTLIRACFYLVVKAFFYNVLSHAFVGFHDRIASYSYSLTGASNDRKWFFGTLIQKFE